MRRQYRILALAQLPAALRRSRGALAALALGALVAACGPEVAGVAAGTAAGEGAAAKRALEEKARAEAQARQIEQLQQERLQNQQKEIDRASQ